MNVTQGNFNYKGQVQRDTQKPQTPADLERFTGQLVAAQTELDWFSNAELKARPATRDAELFEDKRSKKQVEQEKVRDDVVNQMVTQRQQESAKTAEAWTEDKNLQDGLTKRMTQEKSQVRFRKGIEELQGRVADDIAHQKTMEKRGHLFNPQLAQAQQDEGVKQPQTKFTDPAAMQQQQAKEGEAQKAAFAPTLNADARPDMAQTPKRGAQHDRFDAQRGLKGLKAAGQTGEKNQAQIATAKSAQGSSLAKAAQARVEAMNNQPAQGAKASFGGEISGLNLSEGKGQPKAEKTEAKAQSQATRASYTEQIETKELGERIKLSLNNNRTEMTLQLRPEHLGRVQVKLRKDGEMYQGQMLLDSVEAMEAVERSLPELRQSLEAQGIKVEEFTLALREEQENAQAFAQADQQGSGEQAQRQGTQNALNLEESRGFEPRVTDEQPEPGPAKRAADSDVSIYA